MTKLSRMDKYKALREEMDQDTTAANAVKPTPATPTRLSRMAHAQQMVRQNASSSTNLAESKSPVMDTLIDEVKQYNLDKGNSLSDDTQINILKQLDGSQSLHRNDHYMPMEQPEEVLGDTRKLSMDDTMPSLLKTSDWLTDRQNDQKEVEADQEPVVLTNSDLQLESPTLEAPLQAEESPEPILEEVVLPKKEKPVKIKAKPKKIKKKNAPKLSGELTPVKADKVKDKKGSKSNLILNILLVVLLIALFVALGFTYMTLKSLGVF